MKAMHVLYKMLNTHYAQPFVAMLVFFSRDFIDETTRMNAATIG
jgi:hypothetical protein